MSLVFEAATAGGALRIEVAQPAGDAVAAALALAGHEALIVALEAWLQQPLDPRPVLPGEAAAGVAGAADADLLWAHCGAVRLGFAWPLLLNAASVPSASALPVEWPDLAFEIDVAEFSTDPQPVSSQFVAAQLDAAQPSDMQPADAVLLLPPAFEPTWRVLLHGVATTTTTTPTATTTTTTAPTHPPLWADAEWRGPGTALLLCGAPQPGRRRRAAWRVQLATRYQRPLPELLGWTTRAAADDAATPLRIGGAAHLIAAARPPRAGCIAPALGGAGLWIGG